MMMTLPVFRNLRRVGALLVVLAGLLGLDARAQASLRPLLRLDVLSGGPLTDQAYVYFEAGATSAFDPLFDASKLANPSGLNISTYSTDVPPQQLAINGLPPYAAAPLSINMFIGVPAFGTYRYRLAQLDNFGNTQLYLRDLLLNTRTQLLVGTEYSFDMTFANTNGRYNDPARFVLEIEPLGDLVVSNAMTPPQGRYRNVTIVSGGNLQLDKDLDVVGALDLQAGGTLSTATYNGTTNTPSHYVVTGNSFTMAAGSRLTIGEAAGITTSGASGSIQTTTRSFAANADYVYSSVATPPTLRVTGNGLPAQVRLLSIAGYNQVGSAFTLGPVGLSQPVAVTQQLDLFSGLNTNTHELRLKSDPTGGTAIVGATAGTLTGNLTVERAIDPRLNPNAGYRHFANPLNSGPTFSLSTTGGFTPVFNSAAYNASATPNLVTPFPNLFTYDFTAIANSPATAYSPFDRGWRALAPGEANPGRGRGFIAHISAGNKVVFSGTMNEVAQPVALPANPGGSPGWVLLGNPFVAPLDGAGISRPASVPDAFYVFETTGAYAGRYRAHVNGVGSSPLIPVGQAFFVSQSPGAAAGTLTLPLSARQNTYNPATPTLYRGAADLRPQLSLALSGAGSADELTVYCQAGATPGFDAAFDAYKLPSPGQVELAAQAGNDVLSISGLPLLDAAQATRIPLTVSVPQAGTYSFAASALRNLSSADVYLLDAATGQRYNLRTQPRYAFTASAAGALPGRFVLELGLARPTAATAAALAEAVSLYPNPARERLTVSAPAGLSIRKITLLDGLGRTVRQQASPVLELAGLAPGVYTLRLALEQGTVTKKVVVE